MADNSKMLLFGGAAAAAVWYFYFRTPTAAATPAAAAAPAAPATPSALSTFLTAADSSTAKFAGAPNPAVSEIQARVLLAANAPPEGLSADEWDYYLNQVLSPLGMTAPDPGSLFPQASGLLPGWTRGQKLTSNLYWAVTAPALAKMGFSGLGLYRWVQ